MLVSAIGRFFELIRIVSVASALRRQHESSRKRLEAWARLPEHGLDINEELVTIVEG